MLKLNLNCPINETSYGLTSCNILKELIDLGIEITLFPIGQPSLPNHSKFIECVNKGLNNISNYDVNAPSIRIWHQFSLLERCSRGTHIAFPIWEMDRFTKQEEINLQNVDYILSPSEWGGQILQQNGIKTPSSVIPLGVDRSIFGSIDRPNNGVFKVLNVGKTEVRKGHDILPEIFNRAFSVEDDVELYLMPHNPFLSEEETKQWHHHFLNNPLGKAGKIRILPRVETQDQLASIMQQVDLGIFPARAEGFNLEALEMLSCSRNILITNYSAHQQFCNKDNSYLIEIEELESAYDGKWFFNQGRWAKIGEKQINEFVKGLLHYYERWRDGESLYNEEGVKTAQKYTWKNSALAIADLLLELE